MNIINNLIKNIKYNDEALIKYLSYFYVSDLK